MVEILSDEQIGQEFKVLWRCKKGFKERITPDIRGYFDRGHRAIKLIKSLEGLKWVLQDTT